MTTPVYFEKNIMFYHAYKRMPSHTEIMQLAGFRSRNAAFKLAEKLVHAGRLEKDHTGRLLPTRDFRHLAWLGTVVAGYPSRAEEELIDVLSLEEFLMPNKEGTYMLRVKGDSMIEEGIMPGDIVLVERREQAKHGEIVVAQVDGEWTMKRFCKRGKKVTLEAANKKYPPIQPKTELRIAAIVSAVIRKY